jgi:hypothetical protein
MVIQTRRRMSPEAAKAWKRRRRRYLNRWPFKWYRSRCALCGTRDDLEVNHVKYRWKSKWLRRPIYQTDPRWRAQVPDRWLHSACAIHHDEITALHRYHGMTPLEASIRVADKYDAYWLSWRLRLLR